MQKTMILKVKKTKEVPLWKQRNDDWKRRHAKKEKNAHALADHTRVAP